jgi:hypothetical protein
VSFRDIPEFDSLTGVDAPFGGADIALREEARPRFEEVFHQAHSRIRETFGIAVPSGLLGSENLEMLIAEMWSEGWDPAKGDVALFVRDFGVLLAHGILDDLGGLLIFRSLTDLSHVSVWWPQMRIETFPFHKMYKRMTCIDGESLTYYTRSLKDIVQSSR